MRLTLHAAAATLALALAAPAPAATQGFGVYEHGSCAMGRAGTGVAAPCADGSAMFYNPAGLVGRRGLDLTFGVTTIDALGGFTNDTTLERTGLANSAIPVPHLFVRYGVNDRLAVGLGAFVPYGLGTKWPTTFEGRFSGYDNDLQTIYLQPTVAFEALPGLRLGAGLDLAIGKIELNQRLDLFEQGVPGVPGAILGQLGIPRGTEFADVHLESDRATAIGGHFGVTFDVHERIALGARYLTRVSLDYSGIAEFTQIPTGIILPDGSVFGIPGPLPVDTVVAGLLAPGQPLADQAVTTGITMPDQFVAGVAFRVREDLTLFADYQLVRWSVFDTVTINFGGAGVQELVENYRNTNGYRGALEWSPGGGASTLRAGYLYHQAAAPPETVTPLLPEGNRNEITLGYGIQVTSGLRVDAAYQYIRQDDRRGRTRGPLPGEPYTTALNSGLYRFSAHLFGATLHLAF